MLLMTSQPFTAIASPPLTRPPPDPPPSSLNVMIPPPPANVFAKRAPPKPPWILDRFEPSRVNVSKLVNYVSCDVSLLFMFYLCCCVSIFHLKCGIVLLCLCFPSFTCAVVFFAIVSAFTISLLGNSCFQHVNGKAALYMFVKMPQMRWMLSGKKDGADSHDAVTTNLCNSSLFQFSSKRVFNLDTIETTYSRTELASVANLIRNWIDIKTLDSLIFVVMDHVRKSSQASYCRQRPMSSVSGDNQNMHEQTGCFDSDTMAEGVENSPEDNNSPQTMPNQVVAGNSNNSIEENFRPSVEEFSYHNHHNPQHLEDVSTYTNGFTPSSENIAQQNLGLNIGNYYYNNMDNILEQEVYQNSSWDPSAQDMDYANHQEYHQLHNHKQSYNPSTIQDPHYPSPDVLNLHHFPRSSASSILTNPSTICITNPTQKPPNFHYSMSFLGDLPIGSDNSSGSSVSYDPLFPMNLPAQFPALRELPQSLPHVYSMPTNSRNGSRFGGGDEMEGDGGMGVSEFNKVTAFVGKGKGKATEHLTTEKQRREQLKGRYKILRSLIPNSTKDDRASVVGDAIEYLRELIRTVNELKLLEEKKRHEMEICKRRKTEDYAAESCHMKPFGDPDGSIRTSWLQRKSKDSEVDVRIIDDDVTIKLFQRKKVNCLLFVSKVMEELQLELNHVAGGHVGEYCSFLFNSKVTEGSSVHASAIANRVIDVLDTQYAAVVPHNRM